MATGTGKGTGTGVGMCTDLRAFVCVRVWVFVHMLVCMPTPVLMQVIAGVLYHAKTHMHMRARSQTSAHVHAHTHEHARAHTAEQTSAASGAFSSSSPSVIETEATRSTDKF